MMASRGMGAMAPTKMPKGVKKARRDDTDFTQYAEGGEVKKRGWGAKTGIEEAAADEAFKKQYYKSGPVQGPSDDQTYQRVIDAAKREARDEIRRETHGKAPGAYAKGGNVKGNWIADAVKKPGALHEQLGVPQGKKIPAGKLAAAAKKPGKLGQRARFAETLKGMK